MEERPDSGRFGALDALPLLRQDCSATDRRHVRRPASVRLLFSPLSVRVSAPASASDCVSAVKVHYKAFTAAHDEWLSRSSDRIAPHGWHTRTRQPYQPRKQSYWAHNTRKAQLQSAPGAADARVVAYLTALAAQGLRVLPMGGDGNCLFRSVSHQIYGTEDHHALVRASAADYMDVERAFFSDFVVDGPGQFDAYLDAMRRLGEWGDDPEIQAICELYDRPAEIWAYDPVLGARRLRTFLSGRSDSRPPIRLSYFGGGHYDSVVGADWERNLLTDAAGTAEERRLNGARRLRALGAAGGAAGAAALAGDAAAEEAATLASALEASRRQYDESDASVEVALLVSLGLDPDTAAQAAARAAAAGGAGVAVGGAGAAAPAIAAAAATAAVGGANANANGNGNASVGGAAAEEVILRATLRASEEAAVAAADAQLQAALAASRETVAGGEDAVLEIALAESRAAAAAGGGAGIGSHEDAELAAVIAASRAEAGAAGGGVAGMAGMAADDDVAAAIAMSLAEGPHAHAHGDAVADAYAAMLDLQAQMTEEEQIEAVITGRLPQRLGGALLSAGPGPGAGTGAGSSSSGSSSGGSGSAALAAVAAAVVASGGAGAGPASGGAGSGSAAAAPAGASQGHGSQAAAAGSQQLFHFQLQPPSQQAQGQGQGQPQAQQQPSGAQAGGQQALAAALPAAHAAAPAPVPAAGLGMDEDDAELQAALAMSLAGSL